MDRAEELKNEIDQLLCDLISTGQTARKLSNDLEEATAARDEVIHRAWAQGISARVIADMTQLSHARIQQIVDDRDERSQTALGMKPERRQDRERSRMLLNHFVAQQDNVLAGIRQRVEQGFSDEKLSAVVGAARDYRLSWHEISFALGTSTSAAFGRFGWLDHQPSRQWPPD